jgi:small-conductance mechanosensitive channel
MKKVISFILLYFFILLPGYVMADDMEDMKDIELKADQLKIASSNIERGRFEGDDLGKWMKISIKLKSDASLCVSRNEKALLKIQADLDGLGEKVAGEDAEVTKKREAYKKQKEDIDKLLAKCNLFVVASEEVIAQINQAEKSYFKQKYLVKSPDILELVVAYLNNPFTVLQHSGEFMFSRSGIQEVDTLETALSLLALTVSIYLGIWGRKKILSLERRRQWHDDFSENLARATLTTLAHALPVLSGSAMAAIASILVNLEAEVTPFITELFVGLLIFFMATTNIRLLFSPQPPAKMFLQITPYIAEALSRMLKVLAVLTLIGHLAFYTIFSQSIVESNLMLMRNIFSLFFVINLLWTLHVITGSPKFPKLRYISIVVSVAVSLTLVAEWMGYRNLAFTGRSMIVLSFIVFVIFYGIAKVFSDLFNAIDDGSYSWCVRMRKTLGVEDADKVPGMIWLRLLTTIVIWGTFAVLFINAWDHSGSVLEHAKGYIINGFDIGDFRIIPSRVLWALLLFGLVIILSSWVRSQMESNWLKMTSMGAGARDAMVTITGYVMFILAVIVGLLAVGFDFGNIAIVAGALSVGIGFGLQNIVNNFVSGLILLFERPIRKGDWVVVGTTEGYVKEIQIRSTRIQTFDRSDVIVPNSELISNQVTNWVLSSQVGRATIPIGVAYGSNTEKVREILLAIANDNENVIKSGGDIPEPRVIFRAFGESSLDFELRVFLDSIDKRLSVISEINFAIDKAFREGGIEIPFPQRDLHVKSLPEDLEKNNNNKGS